QLGEAQVVRADPVHRADRAAEHVVAAPELAGALDGDDVLGLLDDADGGLVPPGVGADPALHALRDVAAGLAEGDLVLDLAEGLHEALDVLGVRLQQVEGDPLGTLRTDPGESAELVDQVLDHTFVHTPDDTRREPGARHPGRDARGGSLLADDGPAEDPLDHRRAGLPGLDDVLVVLADAAVVGLRRWGRRGTARPGGVSRLRTGGGPRGRGGGGR